MSQEQDVREQARTAIYEGIIATVKELEDFQAPARAAAMAQLAEAFAWAIAPSNAH